MSKLSKRVSLIKESPTFAIINKAALMKKNGQNIIVLAAGEPDFDTPEHIKNAAIEAIKNGKTKYTPSSGTNELKQAIVDKFKRENNLNYSLDEVIASNGGKHSIYNALQAIINPDDEVIIPAPYWVSYPDMVLLAGGKPICIPCGIEDDFKLSAEKLSQAITNKTRAIFINSPSNPTGMLYTESELLAIAKVLKNYPDTFIISDDLYEHLIFEKQQFKNLANIMPELQDRIIVINGVSKAYSMTGWRIGYTACNNKPLIKAMETIQSQSTSNPCSISQSAAVAALNGGIACVEPMLKEFIHRHEYAVKRINNIPGLHCLKAQGAFYVFFDCSVAIDKLYNSKKITEKTDLAFTNFLLENYLVAGVPGSAFGLENFMRISFATSMEELKSGLDRIEQALSNI